MKKKKRNQQVTVLKDWLKMKEHNYRHQVPNYKLDLQTEDLMRLVNPLITILV
jgi:hypothetical protein